MYTKNKFVKMWLIVGILFGAGAILFFSITYFHDSILCDLSCGKRNAMIVALILSSIFGMFIGSLTYYFISDKYEKKWLKYIKMLMLL